jgi:hypothetical protein
VLVNSEEIYYQQILARLWFFTKTHVSGSEICKWVKDQNTVLAEKLIRRLVADNVLVVTKPSPTVRQFTCAWCKYGLTNYLRVLRKFETAFGVQTHFRFEVNRMKVFNHPSSKPLRQLVRGSNSAGSKFYARGCIH